MREGKRGRKSEVLEDPFPRLQIPPPKFTSASRSFDKVGNKSGHRRTVELQVFLEL